MTIKQALNLGYQKTKSTLDSEVLLSYVLKKPKEYLLANQELRIGNQEEKKYKIFLSRRQLGWPVAYLIGVKEFFGLKFKVTPDVLIPRPETETLVELVLKKVKNQKSKVKILDIGTGSGNIIVSLAKTSLNSQVFKDEFFASDISAKALKVARKNAQMHKVKINFRQGSLLKPWLARRSFSEGGKNQKFDIIIANLPYLAKLEHPSTKFEPQKSLVVGKKGLALYEKLFKQTAQLKYKPEIFIEIDPRQTEQIKSLAYRSLPGFKTQVFKDLSGRNRFLFFSSEA